MSSRVFSWKEARKASGGCMSCAEPALPGHTHCERHRDLQRAKDAARRAQTKARRDAGAGSYHARVRQIATAPGCVASFELTHKGGD